MANPANYALIENGTAGVEEAGSDNANPETFTINHYANQIILNPTDRFEIGYLTNIQGRIIQQLSSEQIAEIDRIGTSALPSGTYLIVLCSTDQCVSRMVQIAR